MRKQRPASHEAKLPMTAPSQETPVDHATPAWIGQGIHGHSTQFVTSYYALILDWAKLLLTKYELIQHVEPADITQEVVGQFLSRDSWTYRPSDKSRFRDFLFVTVKNKILDELRRRNRRPADYGAGVDDARFLNAIEQSCDQLVDRLDTEWQGQLKTLKQACERVQCRVEPRRWQAFYWTVVEKRKGTEVAKQLGLSPTAVYSARWDIVQKLREELKNLGYHGPELG